MNVINSINIQVKLHVTQHATPDIDRSCQN